MEPHLKWENDKPTVVALREIAAGYTDFSQTRAARRKSSNCSLGPKKTSKLRRLRILRTFSSQARLSLQRADRRYLYAPITSPIRPMETQKRYTGEAYITHPVAVAIDLG